MEVDESRQFKMKSSNENQRKKLTKESKNLSKKSMLMKQMKVVGKHEGEAESIKQRVV